MRQIIKHFTDTDTYTFSMMYYVLMNYPRSEVRYTFFDRNNTVYPPSFAKLLREQVNRMEEVVLTKQEYEFMKEKLYFLPEWYFTFLQAYRFNPYEVQISQDEEGHLHITIQGKWYSAIMWEMPILSTISELMHELNGDMGKVVMGVEWKRAYEKAEKMLTNGVRWSDMGTRRRFSFDVQDKVIDAFVNAANTVPNQTGQFIGTSNVYLAMKYNLTCIGTIAHQSICAEECVSGLFECNYQVMDKWSRTYDGNVGLYLYDTFSDVVFFDNFSKRLAKTFDGLRVDSGVEEEQTEKIIAKYKELGIDPATKAIVFSNALNVDRAIELHKFVDGRMKDSYGIGTHFMADIINKETGQRFPYSNIVIKLTGFRITENRKWLDCVKLSNDKGKTLGNPEKCEYLLKQIEKIR